MCPIEAAEVTDAPKLPPWQFQPEEDTPGLFIQCASVEQRDAIIATLSAPPVGEDVHLSASQQRTMDRALRDSVKIIDPPAAPAAIPTDHYYVRDGDPAPINATYVIIGAAAYERLRIVAAPKEPQS